MKNLKKTLIMCISLFLIAAVAVGGTIAYLTIDPIEKGNVFSVGKIAIELNEKVDVYGAGTVKENDDGAIYEGVMPGDYLQKEVSIKNVGNRPAYVAVEVTFNNALEINNAIDEFYEPKGYSEAQIQAIYDYIFDGFGINYNPRPGAAGINDARGVIDGTYGLPEHVLKVDFAKTTNVSTVIGATNWFIAGKEKAGLYWVDGSSSAEFDGYYTADMEEYQIRYTYYLLLDKGEESILFNGFNVPASFNAAQLSMFENMNIDIKASAIQADNMAVAEQYKNDANGKAKTAFAILAGDIETPETSNKPSGTVTYGYTVTDGLFGEATGNAKKSFVIKVYSGDTYMGETSLNNVDGIIDGDVFVTWNIKLNAASNTDNYWTMSWEKAPSANLMPTTVELWIDGENVGRNNVQLNSPDNVNKIGAAVVDQNGTILRYVVKGNEANLQEGESLLSFVSNNAELDAAIKAGSTKLVLPAGTFIIPDSAQGKTLTFIGNGDTVIATQDDGSYEGCDYSLDGSTVTFENVTINTDSRTYTGYARMKGTYNNCTINGTFTLYDSSEFNNCTFNVSGDVYNIWTWGAPTATFNKCTFNSDGKALLLYGGTNTKLTVNNCVFNDNGGLTSLKAAIEIGNDYGSAYELIVNNTTVNGYEINNEGINTGTTLWGNKNSMGTDKLNVVVDGVVVY